MGRGPGRLKTQHVEYVRLLQTGANRYQAAVGAGYSHNQALKASTRIENHPEVKKLLELARVTGQIEHSYGLREAVEACDKALAFSYAQEAPNAIAKLLEHKAKLFGLLIEKIDVRAVHIDLKGTLEEARNRAFPQLVASSETGKGGIPAICISTDTREKSQSLDSVRVQVQAHEGSGSGESEPRDGSESEGSECA